MAQKRIFKPWVRVALVLTMLYVWGLSITLLIAYCL